MNTKGLSLNTIPPILIPLRFFLTAPFFGILAALLILFYGPEIWTSRWLPGPLALTHLLTIGFMLMVMIGALYQFIPVMVGQLIPGGDKLVPIIHPLLIVGTLSLVSGFLLAINAFYWVALIALGMSTAVFGMSLLPLLIAKIKDHLIVFILRILLVVLIITIGFGLYMLLAYAYPNADIVFREYTDIHASWGLIGWVVLLIMAVSSQVIPMFFVTPEFSVRYLKIASLLIVMTLVGLFIMDKNLLQNDLFTLLLHVSLSLELGFVAFYILLLINQRRRKLPDVTINFFRVSLTSLLIAVLCWWLFKNDFAVQLKAFQIQFEFTMGLLLIYGLALSAIIGLLQKIVPFLIYLNLQNLSFKHPQSMMVEPKLVLNMKQIISTKQSKIQFYLHLISFILLIVSVYLSQIVFLAGFFMLCNFIWLSYCLFSGFNFYKHNKKEILTFPEMKMDFSI